MTDATAGDSLLVILEEISDLVSNARTMPMSASVLVNRAELLDLISSAQDVVPRQISRAEELLSDADTMRTDARGQADQILADARAHAETLVGQQEVVQAAQTRADTIVAEAHASAAQLSQDADDYCDRQLAQFEIDLGTISSQVAAGRARLADRRPSTSEGIQ